MSDYYFGGVAAIITIFLLIGMASYYAYTIATDKT